MNPDSLVPGKCFEVSNTHRYVRNWSRVDVNGDWILTIEGNSYFDVGSAILIIACQTRATLFIDKDRVGWMYFYDDE